LRAALAAEQRHACLLLRVRYKVPSWPDLTLTGYAGDTAGVVLSVRAAAAAQRAAVRVDGCAVHAQGLALPRRDQGDFGSQVWRAFRTRFADGLSKAQRVLIVIALGLALDAVGRYLASLGGGRPTGWTGYSPLQSLETGMAPWLRLIIWPVLIALWSAASIRLLRPSPGQSGSD
jgi:hypothetical protein